MKFDPVLFLRIAQRNGLTLTRLGNDICVSGHSKIWIPAIKKHKRRLLKHLPEVDFKKTQVDLFEDL